MAFGPHFVVTGLAGATGSAHGFELFESRHERRSNQISHATVEATIRPLVDMISIVVVSTTKPPEGASPLGAGTARLSSVTGNTLSLRMLYEIAVSKVKVCAKNYVPNHVRLGTHRALAALIRRPVMFPP